MPRITARISDQNMIYLRSVAEKSGKSVYALASNFLEMAIEAGRKSGEFEAKAAAGAATMDAKIERIESHAKFNSALLALMLQELTPRQAEKYKELKSKYLI